MRYGTAKGQPNPYYVCNRERIETASAGNCQTISGGVIDRAVGEMLVELMTPLTLDVALQVQDELAARAGEADLWRAQRVQRAREDADLAWQRFMQTRPDNRMGVRLRGGATRQIACTPDPHPSQFHKTGAKVVAEVDRLFERSHRWRDRGDPQPARLPNRTRPRLRSDVGQGGPGHRVRRTPCQPWCSEPGQCLRGTILSPDPEKDAQARWSALARVGRRFVSGRARSRGDCDTQAAADVCRTVSVFIARPEGFRRSR